MIRPYKRYIKATCSTCDHTWTYNQVDEKSNLVCPKCLRKLRFGWDFKVSRRRSYRTEEDKLDLILRYMRKNNIEYNLYTSISEENYSEINIVLATRVYKLPERIENYITRILNIDISLESIHEWESCSICGSGVRIKPDCYSWQPSYIQTEFDIICHKCCKEDSGVLITRYVNELNEGVPSWAKRILLKEGFTRLSIDNRDIFNSGFNYSDTPKKIFDKVISKKGADFFNQHDFIIATELVEQFVTSWSIWVKSSCKPKWS